MLSFTKTRARTSAGPQSRNLSIVGSKKNFLNMKVHPRTALRLCTGRAAHRESRGIALLFLDNGTRRGSGAASRPGRSLHRKRAGTHCTEAWRGAKGQSGLVRKASPPTGFDPRTVQPVASRYIDYATWDQTATSDTVITKTQSTKT